MGKTEIQRKTGHISMRKAFAGAFAGLLCFSLFPSGRAQMFTIEQMRQTLYVNARLDTTGEASLSAWRGYGGSEPPQLLPRVLQCQDRWKPDGWQPEGIRENSISCSRALRRDGLGLEAELDLAPIARELNGSTGMELNVNLPRLGFDSSSVRMTEAGNRSRVAWKAQFAPGVVPASIRIRFGYRRNQLAGIYLPLLGLALALTLISAMMSRAGYAPLALSVILLSTIVWMGAAAESDADGPLRILLFGSPLADFAALFVDLWPPLLCVSLGLALGSRIRAGMSRSGKFGEVFRTYAVVPVIVTCVAGALPHMSNGDWFPVAGWLAAVPVLVLARRAWIRVRTRSRTWQLTTGELKDRVSALAVRVGRPQVKFYIFSPSQSKVANAFALPGRRVFLTAPLVRSLSKRQVDAVAAHELSHTRHSNRGAWMSLCFAMLLCQTPARELVHQVPGGLATAMVVPIAMFFAALHRSRKREFAADASSAALTGDPRAMISSLTTIARINDNPIDMNPVVEWFSSHPSTTKRVAALAVAARLGTAEVEFLCANDDPGERYEIPAEACGGEVFTLGWQRINAGIYGWVVVFGSCGAGLLVAWLLNRLAGSGIVPVLAGIVLGCALTKGAVAVVMARNYARLRRKLAAKLGVQGQIVGLAPDGEARIYSGYRFSDAGLLRFENGRLCYESERIAIALNPADVVEVDMVAAAPSNWSRRQPMVRFRDPGRGTTHAFILHTVNWFATQRRLQRRIERWWATESSPEGSSIRGFNPVPSDIFRNPTFAAVLRGFSVIGGIAFAAAVALCWILRCEWHCVLWALVVTSCAYASMMLPSMLYRPAALPPQAPAPVETN